MHICMCLAEAGIYMHVPGRSGHAYMHVDVDVDVYVQVCVYVTWYAGPWAGVCV